MTADRQPSARAANLGLSLGVALLLVSAALFLLTPYILRTLHPAIPPQSFGAQDSIFHKRFLVLEWGVFVAVLLTGPTLTPRLLTPVPRRIAMPLVIAVSVFIVWFIVHFGNRQFGGWDLSILVDTGWRQVLGLRPYTDFITPNPPGFNLGIYYAFRLFGVSWNAQLIMVAAFCVVTFVWTFALLQRLAVPVLASLSLAFAVQGATILPTCYWWYNNVTSVLATIFFLAVILCAAQELRRDRDGASRAEWISYSLALALLSLMKPNIAGLLIGLATPLLFLVVRRKRRMLAYTAAGAIISIAVLLLHHISIHDMIECYRAAAIERGGFSSFGLLTYTQSQKLQLTGWTLLLAAPLGYLVPQIRTAWRSGRRRELVYVMLFLVAPVITVYGMKTNGEVKDSETPILLVACGIVLFAQRRSRPWLRIFFLAMVASMIVPGIFYGASRQRLLGMGEGMFFQYTGADQPMRGHLFTSLIATPHLDKVQQEMRHAKASSPGPIFLGPRLEFGYADLEIPSPRGWPIYYQPGTSFARIDELRLVRSWQQQHFQTLIFLGDDRTFYPPPLLHAIESEYRPIPGYTAIEVYTRKSP